MSESEKALRELVTLAVGMIALTQHDRRISRKSQAFVSFDAKALLERALVDPVGELARHEADVAALRARESAPA